VIKRLGVSKRAGGAPGGNQPASSEANQAGVGAPAGTPATGKPAEPPSAEAAPTAVK
jgi:hypothetical protein